MKDEEPFAASREERRIFVTALRDFSDRCYLPDLSPSCPFFEVTANGPSCGEQCHDILAEYDHYASKPELWNLGSGISAFPLPARRARRGPEPDAGPFDAGAIRLRDKDKTTDSKHTVSLFAELRELLQEPPYLAEDREERIYLAGAYTEELSKRGFKREELMAAVARLAATAMSLFMAVDVLVNAGEKESEPGFRVPENWRPIQEYLAASIEPDRSVELFAKFGSDGVVSSLTSWNSTLSIEQIAKGAAPPLDTFLNSHVEPSAEWAKSADRGLWTFDRFSQTYLETWSTSSLDLEWEYLHSKTRGCCSAEQMKLRRVEASTVSKVLADRAVDSRKYDRTGKRFKPGDFKRIAIDYLLADKYDAAVSIFEALINLTPNDPEVLNDLGFCLLPSDPSRALVHLERSTKCRGKLSSLTAANCAVALLLLGRLEESYSIASAGLESEAEPGAWLWEVAQDNRTLTLKEGQDTHPYLETFILRVAAALDGGTG